MVQGQGDALEQDAAWLQDRARLLVLCRHEPSVWSVSPCQTHFMKRTEATVTDGTGKVPALR